MKSLALFAFCSLLSFAQNVNSRYTVEQVDLDDRIQKRISRSLREDVDQLVGQKFDAKRVAELATRIAKDVHQKVTSKIEKGVQSEQVRVVFRSERPKFVADASLNKFHYHSQLGVSAGVQTDLGSGGTRIGVGFQTDAEEHLERNIGWSLDASRSLGERVRLQFDFEALRQKWNAATLAALESRPDIPGIYRERYRVEPSIAFAISDGLTFTTGVSIQHFETQFPATRFEASSAWNNTLRFRKRWEDDDSSTRQGMDAGYNLRVATRALDSDFAYVRHYGYLNTFYRFGREEISFRGLAGQLNGTAPLYERFVLGDSRTLRGWNRFDVDPLGGERVAHGSFQYRYRFLAAFYDTGIVWQRRRSKQVRHSVGATAVLGHGQDSPYLTLAFPIRAGGIVPLFMLGMNF